MLWNGDMRQKQDQMFLMSSCHYLHSESKAVTGSALTSLQLKRTKEEEEEKEEEGSPNQEEVKEVEVGWWVGG